MSKSAWQPKDEKDLVMALKVKAEYDLFSWCAVVCGFGENANKQGPRITEDQRIYTDFLDKSTKPIKMILGARGSLKSTVLQSHALRRVSYNPNSERVLLYGEVHEQAKKRLAVLKRVIMYRPLYRMMFGEQNGGTVGYPWNEEVAMLRSKQQHGGREANIETAGLDVVVNARHFSAIYIDDIHSDRNTNTRDQVEAVEEKFHLLMPLLDQGGEIIIAGVFWNDQDLHMRLMENKVLRDKIDVCVASAYVEPDDPGEHGTLRFPSVLTQDSLALQRAVMREDLFACHFLLNPVPKSNAAFKKEWFVTVPRSAATLQRTVLLVDPAGDPSSTKPETQDSDYVALVVIGITEALDLLILDAMHERVDQTEAMELALMLLTRHRPQIIGVEKTGLGNMGYYLKEELRKRGQFAVVEDLMPRGRTKLKRILDLQPLARRRKLFWAQEAQGFDAWWDELSRVTPSAIKSKHDDLIDATAYILDILTKYPLQEAVNTEPEWATKLAGLDPLSRSVWRDEHHRRDRSGVVGMGEFP